MEIVFLLVGMVIGGGAAWFVAKAKAGSSINPAELEQWKAQVNTLNQERSRLEERATTAARACEEAKAELREKINEAATLGSQLSRAQGDNVNLGKRLEEHKQEVDNLQQKFTTEFRNIANDLLEDKSKKFTEQNKINIGEILNPLKEKIKEFEKKVDDTHKEHLTTNAGLKEQIMALKDMNIKMSQDALNLTKALKGESKTQGNWGEVILERLLERSGLTKGQEYIMQESMTTEDGKRYQPDVIIKLPENKHIIIDAKVSLVDYEKFCSCEDDTEKLIYLKNHINSIRRHSKGLGDKEYQKLYNVSGLDFVLMFIPIEPAFSLAFQHDNDLYNEALEKNIVIVSTSNLLAILRTISSIWKQEQQNANAQEIARQSGDLYDKFVGFVDDLIAIGKKIDDSKGAYVGAMNKLFDGKGNLIGRVEKLKALGAKTSKSFSKPVLDRAKIEEEVGVELGE